jgi:hypothetical protein
VIPWLIFAVVLVPLCVVAWAAVRRGRGQMRTPVDEAARQRNEDEFAAAERYQEEWRSQEHRRDHDADRL